MAGETIIEAVKVEGMTLAKMCWRFQRAQPVGYLERAYGLNPGLAAKGPVLPVGTKVILPLEPVTASESEAVVTLWD